MASNEGGVAGNDVAVQVAQAAANASDETVQAIERAAEMNEDPAVAEELESAALAADQTSTRLGWLRGAVNRLFGHG